MPVGQYKWGNPDTNNDGPTIVGGEEESSYVYKDANGEWTPYTSDSPDNAEVRSIKVPASKISYGS